MRIMNGEIEDFVNFLMSLDLKAKDSRMRTRFCRRIAEKGKEVEEEKNDLIIKYGNKDEEGNILKKELSNGNTVWDIQDHESFSREYNELMTEEYVIEKNEENKEMLESVKNSVLDNDNTFKGKEAMVYDRWCEIVEDI